MPDSPVRPGRIRLLAQMDRQTFGQLMRYGAVGFATNGIGYLLYLTVTHLGMPSKAAMSVLYGIGVILGFFGNRGLTFSYNGGVWSSGFRYGLVYLAGYFLNLAILTLCVDFLGYPHWLVQAVAILVVAAFLFLALKFFVFKRK
ncbi:MAG TPA: GtrA family protein [Noviherbaspirillum sp.]|jgi:putative flippase GtrA|uniref:GtrA family protein n=1 Tax=Noviherbaspirillum sp. TaxID=1926288 RepID=UPI002F938DB5